MYQFRHAVVQDHLAPPVELMAAVAAGPSTTRRPITRLYHQVQQVVKSRVIRGSCQGRPRRPETPQPNTESVLVVLSVLVDGG